MIPAIKIAVQWSTDLDLLLSLTQDFHLGSTSDTCEGMCFLSTSEASTGQGLGVSVARGALLIGVECSEHITLVGCPGVSRSTMYMMGTALSPMDYLL